MRVVVHCAYLSPDKLPLSYGMLLAYAQSKLDRAEFDLKLRLIESESSLQKNFVTGAQNVLLCSNYFWNVKSNLDLSKKAKQLDPNCVTIHGGPSTPKYQLACEEFLSVNEHIDIAVRGEGEITLVEALSAIKKQTHKSAVINGATVVSDGKIVRHPERSLIKDVNSIPSPYLTGIFDSVDTTKWWGIPIETNRGCPYVCAYCDWARSKVRAYDFDRVISEIEWVSKNRHNVLYLIDANFGILRRDIDIARKICDISRESGFPKSVEACFSKNAKESLLNIVQTFTSAGLVTRGIVGVQTRDERTLNSIMRKNIRMQDTDKIGATFRKLGLKLHVDLMLGLPSATVDSYMADLRYYYNQPYAVGIHRAVLTPNSPMAEPSFKMRYKLQVDDDGYIISTSTMSSSEMKEMKALTCLFNLTQQYRIRFLRYPLLWLEHDRGVDIISLLREFAISLMSEDQYPILKSVISDESPFLFQGIQNMYNQIVPSGDWHLVHDEFARWVTQHLHLSELDIKAFKATIMAQTAVMPSHKQTYPFAVTLDHDVRAWGENIEQQKGDLLINYPSAEFKVITPETTSWM